MTGTSLSADWGPLRAGGSGAEMVRVPSLAIELVTLWGSTPRGSEKLCEMFLRMAFSGYNVILIELRRNRI